MLTAITSLSIRTVSHRSRVRQEAARVFLQAARSCECSSILFVVSFTAEPGLKNICSSISLVNNYFTDQRQKNQRSWLPCQQSCCCLNSQEKRCLSCVCVLAITNKYHLYLSIHDWLTHFTRITTILIVLLKYLSWLPSQQLLMYLPALLLSL